MELHEAAYYGLTNKVQSLLKQDVPVNSVNEVYVHPSVHVYNVCAISYDTWGNGNKRKDYLICLETAHTRHKKKIHITGASMSEPLLVDSTVTLLSCKLYVVSSHKPAMHYM